MRAARCWAGRSSAGRRAFGISVSRPTVGGAHTSSPPAAPAAAVASAVAAGGVELTERAAERICALAAAEGRPTVLRLRVDSGGCNGFEYKFDLESDAREGEDLVDVERGGARLRVDRLSLPFLHGSVVDYTSTLMSASFVVASNPNAATSCGCKHSFAVDPVKLATVLNVP